MAQLVRGQPPGGPKKNRSASTRKKHESEVKFNMLHLYIDGFSGFGFGCDEVSLGGRWDENLPGYSHGPVAMNTTTLRGGEPKPKKNMDGPLMEKGPTIDQSETDRQTDRNEGNG